MLQNPISRKTICCECCFLVLSTFFHASFSYLTTFFTLFFKIHHDAGGFNKIIAIYMRGTIAQYGLLYKVSHAFLSKRKRQYLQGFSVWI